MYRDPLTGPTSRSGYNEVFKVQFHLDILSRLITHGENVEVNTSMAVVKV